jgi:hypothetical protein
VLRRRLLERVTRLEGDPTEARDASTPRSATHAAVTLTRPVGPVSYSKKGEVMLKESHEIIVRGNDHVAGQYTLWGTLWYGPRMR